MPGLLGTIHVVGLLTCFALLGTSRIGACIRFLALQGVLFSLVPVIAHDDGMTLRVLGLAGANVALKGMIFPAVLLHLRARAGARGERGHERTVWALSRPHSGSGS